jgi:hypothetical protein
MSEKENEMQGKEEALVVVQGEADGDGSESRPLPWGDHPGQANEEENDTWGIVSPEPNRSESPSKKPLADPSAEKSANPPASASVTSKIFTKFYNGPRDPSLPPSQVSHRIFASNLSFETGWKELKEFMDEIGTVVYIDILTTQGGSKSKVFFLEKAKRLRYLFLRLKNHCALRKGLNDSTIKNHGVNQCFNRDRAARLSNFRVRNKYKGLLQSSMKSPF